jgi:hypothetical protein
MNKAILILPLVLLSLLSAIWSGWLRIGWVLPVSQSAAQHGALMVGSFLSTLIFLERAVTFRQKWVLLLPFVNGLSVVFFLVGQTSAALLCLIAGSAGFWMMCGYFIYKYEEQYYYVFFAGAFCLLAGNVILYKTNFYPNAVNWWMAYLLLTIVAERLELSRFLSLSKGQRAWLVGSLTACMATLFVPFHWYGNILFAGTLVAVAAWLLSNDMARRSLKVKGQHRYSALLLLIGYGWLLVTAGWLVVGKQLAFGYDAALHSFFIGFVFSMIFSHAPIILPAVLKLPIKLFRPSLYGWFFLLQASLLVRIVGDMISNVPVRRVGGLLNGVAILLFFINVAVIVRQELGKRNRRTALKTQ